MFIVTNRMLRNNVNHMVKKKILGLLPIQNKRRVLGPKILR
jgi:hypothetical protein